MIIRWKKETLNCGRFCDHFGQKSTSHNTPRTGNVQNNLKIEQFNESKLVIQWVISPLNETKYQKDKKKRKDDASSHLKQ